MKSSSPPHSAAVGVVPVLLFALLLTACNSEVQEKSQKGGTAVPMHEDPVHQIILKNEFTNVYSAELPPGGSTMLHRHDRDYVYVVFSPGELEDFPVGKPAQMVHLQQGEVRYAHGGFAHRDVNRGATPFRCIAAEIVKVSPSGSRQNSGQAEERSLDIGHGHIEDVVLDNDQVRVTEVQIAPEALSDEDTSGGPSLIVLMSDAELHPTAGAEPPMQGKTGEVFWRPQGSTARLHNVGKQQAHFARIEFKAGR